MSNRISMDKKYTTRDGRPVRILAVDFDDCPYTVVAAVTGTYENGTTGEILYTYLPTGEINLNKEESPLDLVEAMPFADFKLDEPVMVRMAGDADWTSRHFACANTFGTKAMCWCDGGTSWTAVNSAVWDECRRPTAEELAS